MQKIEKEILKKIFPERPIDKYFVKYDFGLLIVIGGSDFYSGSPALNAMAAFKVGVGMVRIIAPRRAADIIASFSPNLAAYPLDGKWLTKRHLPTLIELTETAKQASYGNVAGVIGGGLGRSKETQEAVLEYLKEVEIPFVIDADAIHAIAKDPKILENKKFLLTPHGYEFFVLTGKRIPLELPTEEKAKIIKEETAKLKTTILFKGKPDIISDGKDVFLNYTGSPYMAVGGTGDVLAGICGALMAKKVKPLLAAQAGVFINGRAGEIAAKKFKEGLTATDVLNAIPEVIKEV
jgi:NAD(P)H-hydrate epimerase